jgi:hypothetical protein
MKQVVYVRLDVVFCRRAAIRVGAVLGAAPALQVLELGHVLLLALLRYD